MRTILPLRLPAKSTVTSARHPSLTLNRTVRPFNISTVSWNIRDIGALNKNLWFKLVICARCAFSVNVMLRYWKYILINMSNYIDHSCLRVAHIICPWKDMLSVILLVTSCAVYLNVFYIFFILLQIFSVLDNTQNYKWSFVSNFAAIFIMIYRPSKTSFVYCYSFYLMNLKENYVLISFYFENIININNIPSINVLKKLQWYHFILFYRLNDKNVNKFQRSIHSLF